LSAYGILFQKKKIVANLFFDGGKLKRNLIQICEPTKVENAPTKVVNA